MKYDPDVKIEECSEVYPPMEDTFLLLESAEVTPGQRVLEMGSGSGLISVHLARAGAQMTAADANPKAVECTRANAARNGVEVSTLVSDLFSNVRDRFDLILFNPPYLAVDEEGDLEKAWSGGESGVEILSRFLSEAPPFLSRNGSILLLVSSEMEESALDLLLSEYQVEQVASRRFFFEELRVLRLRKKATGR